MRGTFGGITMVYEFEGRTEAEAVDKAVEELHLDQDQFDVEILEVQKSSLFKKGFVKIRVHLSPDETVMPECPSPQDSNEDVVQDMQSYPEYKKMLKEFVLNLIELLGYDANVENVCTDRKNIVLHLSSHDSPIIIGKHGKNLDALQLLANTFLSNKGFSNYRVLLDCENYRARREESLVRLAYETADKVVLSRHSILLEPMNPYERRLIHTTLNELHDIQTKSEGEGAFRRVRVSLR